MANHTDRFAAQDHWNNPSSNVPTPVRFTMLGQMQLQQPLDFSGNTSPAPINVVKQEENVVDLSVRARNSTGEDSSSSASSVKSEHPHEPSHQGWPLSPMNSTQFPAVTPQFPIMTPTQLPTFFKKSSSMTRPFKAYPKDPLNLPIGLVGGVSLSPETILSDPSNKAYAEFRRQMLAQVVAAKTRRTSSSPVPDEDKPVVNLVGQATQPEEAGSPQHPSSSATDPAVLSKEPRDPAYWERRRKNNEAAKRSRDARRAKEDEIAIRAAFLEQENLKLKYEVAALRNETSRLRCLLYSNN